MDCLMNFFMCVMMGFIMVVMVTISIVAAFLLKDLFNNG